MVDDKLAGAQEVYGRGGPMGGCDLYRAAILQRGRHVEIGAILAAHCPEVLDAGAARGDVERSRAKPPAGRRPNDAARAVQAEGLPRHKWHCDDKLLQSIWEPHDKHIS